MNDIITSGEGVLWRYINMDEWGISKSEGTDHYIKLFEKGEDLKKNRFSKYKDESIKIVKVHDYPLFNVGDVLQFNSLGQQYLKLSDNTDNKFIVEMNTFGVTSEAPISKESFFSSKIRDEECGKTLCLLYLRDMGGFVEWSRFLAWQGFFLYNGYLKEEDVPKYGDKMNEFPKVQKKDRPKNKNYRKGFKNIPLNFYQDGFVGHHVSDEEVVYIPLEVHDKFLGMGREEHRRAILEHYGGLERMKQKLPINDGDINQTTVEKGLRDEILRGDEIKERMLRNIDHIGNTLTDNKLLNTNERIFLEEIRQYIQYHNENQK